MKKPIIHRVFYSLFIVTLLALAPTHVPLAQSPSVELVSATARPSSSMSEEQRSAAKQTLAQLPFSFVRNDGQADARVRYYAQRGGFSSYFTQDAAMLVFRQSIPDDSPAQNESSPKDEKIAKSSKAFALALTYLDANPTAAIEGQGQQQGRRHFLTGANQATWQRDVPGYDGVVYRDLWPGIDMTFREEAGSLKYAFVVRPGADPKQIKLAYGGADGLTLRDDGALSIETAMGALVDERPVSFQTINGKRVPVETAFALASAETTESAYPAFGFALAAGYDPAQILVIDPGLVYSTFLGGGASESVNDIAVDSFGNVVAVGRTSSSSFPTTSGAFDTTYNGSADAYVTKLNADGSGLIFSTILGGDSIDLAFGIALDSLDRPVVVGQTRRGTIPFPTTPGAFDTITNDGNRDAFVTKLSADGSSLVYSTLLGDDGTDLANGIALDSLDRPVVVGLTSGGTIPFPTTPGAFDTTFNGPGKILDAFITKLTADGSDLVFSTFLGGNASDIAYDVVLDSLDRPVVVGRTEGGSIPLPTTPGAFDTTYNGGGADAFVTKLTADGSGLVTSTFLGGNEQDVARGIALDSLDRSVVAGQTDSGSFPTTPGSFDTTYNGNFDAFVTKLTTDGSDLVFSSFLGGSSIDGAHGVALDSQDRPVVAGRTDSGTYPTTLGAFDTSHNGSLDGFFTTLSADGSSLADSSFFGGSDRDLIGFQGGGVVLDAADNIYINGVTCSSNFPITPGVFQSTLKGTCNGFLAKFGEASANNTPPIADAGPDQSVGAGAPFGASVTLDGSGSSDPDVGDTLTYEWSGPFGTASGVSPTVIVPLGSHSITLTVTDDGGASASDTVTITVADVTAPVVTVSLDPTANANGWHKSDVTVNFSATDAISPPVGCDPAAIVITTEGASQVVTSTCSDGAGNTAVGAATVSIDKTLPLISAIVSPLANALGWHNTDPTVSFNCTDALSGIDSCSPPETVTAETAGLTVTGTALDLAGNSAIASALVKLDKTAPLVSFTGCPVSTVLNEAVSVTLAASDALSGVASQSLPNGVHNLDTTVVGTQSLSVTATDNAGNSTTNLCTYDVLFDFAAGGGFSAPLAPPPAVNTAKGGSVVPVKWQIPDGMGGFISDLSIVSSLQFAEVSCATGEVTGGFTDAAATGGSKLRYDAATDQFVFNWKTNKSMSGQCFVLNLNLSDGSSHPLRFDMK